MKYIVINRFTGEEMYGDPTIIGCRQWIRLGDKEDWKNYTIVDSNGTPIDWQVEK